jgi:hypothetical protein
LRQTRQLVGILAVVIFFEWGSGGRILEDRNNFF